MSEELAEYAAGRELAKKGFHPHWEGHPIFAKVFADSVITVQLDKAGEMRAPRKLTDPVLVRVYDLHEPMPSLGLVFPTVKAFLDSIYEAN